MRLRQIVMGLHFRQAAHQTVTQRGIEVGLKCVTVIGLGDQLFDWHAGGQHQFHPAIVELVNHPDKSPQPVRHASAKHGQSGHQYCVIALGKFNVIRLAAWAVAQGNEIKPNYVARITAHRNAAALDLNLSCSTHLVACNGNEFGGHPLISVCTRVINACLFQLTQPVIDAAIDIENSGVLLEQGYRFDRLDAA